MVQHRITAKVYSNQSRFAALIGRIAKPVTVRTVEPAFFRHHLQQRRISAPRMVEATIYSQFAKEREPKKLDPPC